ncbi:MAG: 16S rRNA (uracil(1498)-N(3))-methyltransferase [Cyclobacteriaceae bacterium]|nr:16S rRNA (uracil(1498)-N(3))-methyltransferase [Cyclobacteriaceae bacterium]
MDIFYDPDFSLENPYLSQAESHHCLKVLRHKPGDQIGICDGKGALHTGTLGKIETAKTCHIENMTTRLFKKSSEIHIAIAPTKNMDRMEWFVEKATELGVDTITPIISFHSERKKINSERLNKKAISSLKQSKNTFLPRINQPVQLNRFLDQNLHLLANKYIASLIDPDTPHLYQVPVKHNRSVVLIGPEGDFSLEEENMAREAGFVAVSLGDNTLRTETAGIVALHTLLLRNLH